MKVYISGAITSNEEKRDKQFEDAERWLKSNGYDVVNPLKVCATLPETFTHEEYMSVCLKLVEVCDMIYLLCGWQSSKGAKAELSYAKAIGKKVKYEEKQWEFKRLLDRDLPFPEIF